MKTNRGPILFLSTILMCGTMALAPLAQAQSLPAAKPGETLKDVLTPKGKPVGTVSRDAGLRQLPGGEVAATALFERLTAGATDITPAGFGGKVMKRADGAIITYRFPVKDYSPAAVLVQAPGIAIRQIEFTTGKRQDGGGGM